MSLAESIKIILRFILGSSPTLAHLTPIALLELKKHTLPYIRRRYNRANYHGMLASQYRYTRTPPRAESRGQSNENACEAYIIHPPHNACSGLDYSRALRDRANHYE